MFKKAGFALGITLVAAPAWAQDKPDLAKTLEDANTALPPLVSTGAGPEKTVTVDAESEVLVEHRESANAPWKHICASPCAFAPQGGEYRVIGVNVSPSEPFAVTGKGALKIDIGWAPKMRRGEWLMGIGGGVAAVGLAFLFSALAFTDPGPGGVVKEDKIPLLGVGTALSIAGAGVGLYGAGAYWENHRSGVSGPVGDIKTRTGGFMIPVAFTF